jgi:hypothetical protein
MQDIYEVSLACSTSTYIWGGFTLDIVEGRFLREHHDLDGFTLNLLDVLPDMTALYESRGYGVEFNQDFDILGIKRDGLHAAFNHLETDGAMMMWRHIGNEGTVYFPAYWLDDAPRDFYGTPVYTAGIQLDYALKTNIRLVHAEWSSREKDQAAIRHLERLIERDGLDPEVFLREVWSYNPFWAKRGYPEYAMPILAQPPRTREEGGLSRGQN